MSATNVPTREERPVTTEQGDLQQATVQQATVQQATVQHGPTGSAVEHVSAHGAVEHSEGHGEHDSSGDPQNWGQHHEFGGMARKAGWIVVVILLLNLLVTHYNKAGFVAILLTVGGLVISLLWDRNRRKNAWRE
jgi:hypothetical protein